MLFYTANYPFYIEKEYKTILRKYISDYIAIVDNNFKEYVTSKVLSQYMRLDDLSDDLEKLRKKNEKEAVILLAVLLPKIKYIAKKINKFILQNIERAIKKINKIKPSKHRSLPLPNLYDIRKKELIKLYVNTNVNLIKSINNNLLAKVEQEVYNTIVTNSSYKELSKAIMQIADVTKAKADFIARDQIGKLNGQLGMERCLDVGCDQFRWLTANDDRVRRTHKALDGKICQWNNVTTFRHSEKGRLLQRSSINGCLYQPGQDFQCRCTFIALLNFDS